MAKIILRINEKTGVMKVSSEGLPGEGCLTLTKPLRDGLGITDEPDKTAEYYAEEQTNEPTQSQGS